MNKSEHRCHICGEPFNVFRGEELPFGVRGGVIVRCDNRVSCLQNENVFGHGDNEKEAVFAALEKYSSKSPILRIVTAPRVEPVESAMLVEIVTVEPAPLLVDPPVLNVAPPGEILSQIPFDNTPVVV